MAEHEHAGHRKRLLAKLESGALEDHEYLEALLFNAIPRMNTNGIAHRLLARFGSVERVFEATVDELKTVDGIGENAAQYLYLIGRIFQKMQESVDKNLFPRYYDEEEFVEFLKEQYKDAKKEFVDCFFIDEQGKIKQTFRFTTGQEFSVHILTNELDKKLAISHPYGLIVSHNHLKGSSTPSQADEETTMKLQVMCSLQNVRFCDHLIISPIDVYSYHSSGRLKDISHKYSMSSIIKTMQKDEQSLMKKFQ